MLASYLFFLLKMTLFALTPGTHCEVVHVRERSVDAPYCERTDYDCSLSGCLPVQRSFALVSYAPAERVEIDLSPARSAP